MGVVAAAAGTGNGALTGVNQLQLLEVIGNGSFGVVYKALWRWVLVGGMCLLLCMCMCVCFVEGVLVGARGVDYLALLACGGMLAPRLCLHVCAPPCTGVLCKSSHTGNLLNTSWQPAPL